MMTSKSGAASPTLSSGFVVSAILAIAIVANNVAWYALSRPAATKPQYLQEVSQSAGGAKSKTRNERPATDSQRSTGYPSRPPATFEVEGIIHPSLCRPSDVVLPDNEKVIGVVVDGEARAYVVKALSVTNFRSPEDCAAHLVTDSVREQPLWVVHCNLTHSTRVLTSDPQEPAPNVRIGGWSDGLRLMVGTRRFDQNDESLPLSDVDYTMSCWKNWLTTHPGTLVYTGGACFKTSTPSRSDVR